MLRKLAAMIVFSLVLTAVNAQEDTDFSQFDDIDEEYPQYNNFADIENSWFIQYNDTEETENTVYTQYEDFTDAEYSDGVVENLSFWKSLDWAFRGSILYFVSGNAKQDADPSPILPSLGVSAIYNFSNRIRFEVIEDIYYANYEYNTKTGIPMPCNQENRSAFVLGFMTGFQVTGVFAIGRTGVNIRAFVGPVMDIRIVVRAFGLKHPDDYTGVIESDVNLQTKAIRKYFWSGANWFYPVIGVGADYPINENYFLGLDLRLWYPLSSATDWRIGASIRITPRKNR